LCGVRADNVSEKKIVPRATRRIYGRFYDTLKISGRKGKYRLVVSNAKFKDGEVPNREREREGT
jgi:hypothetical protein